MSYPEPSLFDTEGRADSRRQRDDALARVERNALDEWKRQAMDAAKWVANRINEATAEDIWRVLEWWDVPPPHEPRAMGPIMKAAVKAGWFIPTDRYVASARKTRNAGPVRVYRSRVWAGPDTSWRA